MVPVALLVLAAATPAHACTTCHTPVAREVRAHVFGPTFAAHAFALALPLPLLAAVIAGVALERRPRVEKPA